MTAEAWAAWVQAVGSILTIGAGFAILLLQNRHADRVREAERARRADVVVYRLSGWLDESPVRVERALKVCEEELKKAMEGPPRAIADLRLGMVTKIDGVLADLHYLAAGSGDITRLDQYILNYETWLERNTAATILGATPALVAGPSRRDFYSRVHAQLTAISTAHDNVEHRLARPLRTRWES